MQPNIIILVPDDVGREQFRELGYDSGNTYPTMPFFSRLVQQGVLFRRAYASPWCSPTRVKMHTGYMAYQSGVAQLADRQQPLLEEWTSLPAAVKMASDDLYATACVGKWHMANYANTGDAAQHPIIVGYDYFCGQMVNLAPGETFYGWNCTESKKTATGIKHSLYRVDEWQPDFFVRKALEWVNTVQQPFLLYFPSANTHDPLARPPSDQYDTDTWDLPAQNQDTDASLADQRAYFKAACESMDYSFQQLIDGLPQSVRSNTIIIYWPDNGTPADVRNDGDNADHMKQTCYDAGCNVPLVIAGAGVATPGRTNTNLVSAADLWATCVALTQGTTSVPETAGLTRRSISLAPVLASASVQHSRTYDLLELFSPNAPNLNFATNGTRALVNNSGYKIMKKASTGTGGWPSGSGGTVTANFEFYYCVGDPNEAVNLIGSGSPFVSGSTITLTDVNATYPLALTNYNALVSLYGTVASSYT